MLQHQRSRFMVADLRNGRRLDYEVLANEEERAKLHERIGDLEERTALVEEHLARVLRDINFGDCFGRSPYSPCEEATTTIGGEDGAHTKCDPSETTSLGSYIVSPPVAPRQSGPIRTYGRAIGVGAAARESSRQDSKLGVSNDAVDLRQDITENTWREFCQIKSVVVAMQTAVSECQIDMVACREELRARLAQLELPMAEVQSQISNLQFVHHGVRKVADEHQFELGNHPHSFHTKFKDMLAETGFQGDIDRLSNRIAQLENGHTMVHGCVTDLMGGRAAVAEQLAALEKLQPALDLRLIELEENRLKVEAHLNKSGKALIGATSDLDMLEARMTAQLQALEANQDRQGRALQGHIANFAVK